MSDIEFINNIKNEFEQLKKQYNEKKNNVEVAKKNYIDSVINTTNKEVEYMNELVIDKDNKIKVIIYNEKDLSKLEQAKEKSKNPKKEEEALKDLAIFYNISNNDWGIAEKIKPVKEWYTEKYSQEYEIPIPDGVTTKKTNKLEFLDDNGDKFENKNGPYYDNCSTNYEDDGSCDITQADAVCSKYGAFVCNKQMVENLKKDYLDNKKGWSREKGKLKIIKKVSDTSLVSKGFDEVAKGSEEGNLAKSFLKGVSVAVDNSEKDVEEEKVEEESKAGVFCCKNIKCQKQSTEKGIWIKNKDDSYQKAEFDDVPKICKNISYIAPDFTSPNLFSKVSERKKRPKTTKSGWWDTKVKTYYPEMYFVNRFGYKQKINTEYIVEKIKDLKNVDDKNYSENYNEIQQFLEKFSKFDKVYLTNEEINKIESGADIVGDTIYVDNVGNNITYNNQIAWVDIKGNKNVYANAEVFSKRNNISCPSEVKNVSGEAWLSSPLNDIVSEDEYTCLYMDNTAYENLKKAQKELNEYVESVENYINNIDEIDKQLKANLLKLQKEIRSDIVNINTDIDETTKLRMMKDTAKGKLSNTKLTMESNKVQLKIWLFISLVLFIFAINNISGEIEISNFNIFMLIAIVIILFILGRRMYIARII